MRSGPFLLFACLVLLPTEEGRAQIAFSEEAISRGVIHVTYGFEYFGFGLGLDDLDGDGDPDLVLTGGLLGQVRIFENDGTGNFIERTGPSGLPSIPDVAGVSLADHDADGDLDILLLAMNSSNRMLENLGSFIFEDISVASGLADLGPSTSATWGDFDGDGLLDIYVSNYNDQTAGTVAFHPNRLLRNEGNGAFTDVAALHGVDDGFPSFQAVMFDPDRDGDLELYLSNDRGYSNPIYHNKMWEWDGASYANITSSSGSGLVVNSMGLDVGDLDADGEMDIYVTNTQGQNKLLLGLGDLDFAESSLAAGVAASSVGWGTCFIDFDNDGFQELFVCTWSDVNRLFDCDGVFPCLDLAPQLDLALSPYGAGIASDSFCVAMGDIDLDGDVDLVVQSSNEPVAIYINHEGETRNWTRIRLTGAASNPFAVGAHIRVTSGGSTQWREVRAGAHYRSSSELAQTFGLGTAPIIDEVLVRWPDGTLGRDGPFTINKPYDIDIATFPVVADCDHDMVPDVDEIAADPSLDLNLDGLLDACTAFRRGDPNGDGQVDIADVIEILSLLFSGGGTEAGAACPAASDINDDSLADIADPIALLAHLFVGAAPPPPPGPECGADPTDPTALLCATPPICD